MTIEVIDVCKSYDGKEVLKNVNLMISSESAYVVTGPSGSGKTTFLRILLRLERPDSGQVNLLGDYKYDRVNAGVVFQEDRLCESFTAVENVAMVNKNLSGKVAREELVKLLPADELDKPVSELSGGMRRRVAIVRACIIPSDVLILDEPFNGLDAENRRKAIAYIRECAGHTPIVIASHELDGLEFCKTVDIKK